MSQTVDSAPKGGDLKKAAGRSKAMENFSRYHTLAIEMAVAVITPVIVGRWLDTKTGKEPWFTLAGMVLGGAAAFRSVQRTIGESRKALKEGEDESSREPSE